MPVSATATSARLEARAPRGALLHRDGVAVPCSPVAALALPELTTAARSRPRSQRSRQTRTGAAAAALRVSSSDEATSGSSQTRIPTSVPPEAFSPQATPAARNPGASAVGSSSSIPSGRSTQRERKNPLIALAHEIPVPSSRP